VVYALAIVAAVAVLTPVLMVCLRLTWLAVHVVPEVDAEPNGDDRDYERRYRQFAELGFQPAGATRETCWFISPFDWYWRSHDHHRWMATPDGEARVHVGLPVAYDFGDDIPRPDTSQLEYAAHIFADDSQAQQHAT